MDLCEPGAREGEDAGLVGAIAVFPMDEKFEGPYPTLRRFFHSFGKRVGDHFTPRSPIRETPGVHA